MTSRLSKFAFKFEEFIENNDSLLRIIQAWIVWIKSSKDISCTNERIAFSIASTNLSQSFKLIVVDVSKYILASIASTNLSQRLTLILG